MNATEGTSDNSGRVSLFYIACIMVERRWPLVLAAIVGAAVATAPVLFKPQQYVSRASFISREGDGAPSSGLRGLAGQFGIAIPGATGGSLLSSPPFLTELVGSPMILGPIVDDTVAVREGSEGRVKLLHLLDVDPRSEFPRDDAIRLLAETVSLEVSQRSGAMTLIVRTEWPSVSTHVATRVLELLEEFTLQVSQGDARREVRSVESLLSNQRSVLAAAEERLGQFMKRNRQPGLSTDLQFDRDRLEREVSLQQQVLVELAQSREQARIRALREVFALTIVERPTTPLKPEPRGRLLRAAYGALIGLILGSFVVLLTDFLSHRRIAGDPEADRFIRLVRSLLPFRRKASSSSG